MAELLRHDKDMAASFLNSVLNQLNWAFSEFIGMIQEVSECVCVCVCRQSFIISDPLTHIHMNTPNIYKMIAKSSGSNLKMQVLVERSGLETCFVIID